jgi:hypothetical protein
MVEVGTIVKIFIYIILLGIVIVITVFNSIAQAGLGVIVRGKKKGKEKDEGTSEFDIEFYKKAQEALKSALVIGWIVIGIIVVLGIIIIVFSPEIATAAAELVEVEAEQAEMEQVQKAILDYNKIQKNKKDPLFLYSFFGDNSVKGWVSRIIYIGLLTLLAVLGSYSAVAAFQIMMTEQKYYLNYVIWSALLGLLPITLALIWVLAAVVYYRNLSSKEKELKEKYKIKPKPKKSNLTHRKLSDKKTTNTTHTTHTTHKTTKHASNTKAVPVKTVIIKEVPVPTAAVVNPQLVTNPQPNSTGVVQSLLNFAAQNPDIVKSLINSKQ